MCCLMLCIRHSVPKFLYFCSCFPHILDEGAVFGPSRAYIYECLETESCLLCHLC